MKTILLALIALCSLAPLHSANAKPLKVFILAGQSNMESPRAEAESSKTNPAFHR